VHELRRTVQRRIQLLAKRRCPQPLPAPQRILRGEHETRAVEDPEGNHVVGHERGLHTLAELFRLRGAAPHARVRIALFGRQPRGARHDVRIARDPSCFRHVLADPDVEALDDCAEQRFGGRHARFRQRVAHAVVCPDAEPEQQRAEQHGGGVAPRFRLDQTRNQIGNGTG
jgi:hypothetical protein